MANADVVVFLSLIVIIFVFLFVGLGLPQAKEDRRIRKAQAEARKYLREIEEGRKTVRNPYEVGTLDHWRFKEREERKLKGDVFEYGTQSKEARRIYGGGNGMDTRT